jgi:hypothetical protein
MNNISERTIKYKWDDYGNIWKGDGKSWTWVAMVYRNFNVDTPFTSKNIHYSDDAPHRYDHNMSGRVERYNSETKHWEIVSKSIHDPDFEFPPDTS